MGVVQAVKKGRDLPKHVRLVGQEYVVMGSRQSNHMRRGHTIGTEATRAQEAERWRDFSVSTDVEATRPLPDIRF